MTKKEKCELAARFAPCSPLPTHRPQPGGITHRSTPFVPHLPAPRTRQDRTRPPHYGGSSPIHGTRPDVSCRSRRPSAKRLRLSVLVHGRFDKTRAARSAQLAPSLIFDRHMGSGQSARNPRDPEDRRTSSTRLDQSVSRIGQPPLQDPPCYSPAKPRECC